ncbi:SFI1 Protein SFI1 [Candida maltosa Xu316]
MEYQEPLHNIIKDFHRLKEFKSWDNINNYEVLLRSSLTKLIKLVGVDQKYKELFITTSNNEIGNLELRCYGNIVSRSLSGQNILDYLETKHISALHAMIDLLDRRAINIKSSYESVFTGISNFFESLLSQRDEAETNLIDYISKCLTYETKLSSGIGDNALNPEDTEKLAKYLDAQLSPEEDSMFSYNEVDSPLDFYVNSETFSDIYKIFLGVLRSNDLKVKSMASAIVAVYKKHGKVDYFALADSKDVLLEFCDQILPQSYQSINERVISQILQLEYIDPKDVLSDIDDIMEDFVAVGIHQVDPDFPQLLKHYMDCKNNVFPTLTSKADLDFLSKIRELIGRVIEFRDTDDDHNSDDDDDIRDVVSQFISLHKLLSKGNYLLGSSLLMRASVDDYYRNLQIKRIVFDGWKEKLNYVLDLESTTVLNTNLQSRYMNIWYEAVVKRDEKIQKVNEFYERSMCLKIIDRWKCLLEFYGHYNKVANQILMKKYFTIWVNSQNTVTDNYEKAMVVDRQNLLSKFFGSMKSANTINQHSAELARKIYEKNMDSRIKQEYFQIWNARVSNDVNLLTKKLNQFNELRNKSVLQNHFINWLYKVKLLQKANRLSATGDVKLMEHILNNVWRKRMYLNQKAYSIETERNNNLQKLVISKWKLSVDFDSKANAFYNKCLLSRVLTNWKLKSKSLNKQNLLQRHLLRQFFKNWQLRIKLNMALDRKTEGKKAAIFKLWKGKSVKLSVLADKSVAFVESSLKNLYFGIWENKYAEIELLQYEADKFPIGLFFNKWRSTLSILDDIKIYPLADIIATKHAYRIWREKYFIRYEERLEDRIELMDTVESDQLRKRRYLNMWKSKFRYVKSLDFPVVIDVSTLKEALSKWRSKTDKVNEYLAKATVFHEVLSYKWFRLWHDRYNLTYDRDFMEQEFVAVRNCKLLKDVLRNWKMVYTKNIKRHEQMCVDFIVRRDVTKLKSIFDLWNYKTKEREMATTEYSNESPLSRRTHLQQQQQMTPEKRRLSPPKPSTPTSRGPSPSKLQETTKRIRDQNILALRERLGRAKSEFTPQRLSPIKMTYPAIVPKLEPRTSPKFNDSDIATAKSLGRIQPMIFPVDEEANFSPMSKSKLQSRSIT